MTTNRAEIIERDLLELYLWDEDDDAPKIAGFDDLEFLDRGGMGVVYSAIQTRLNRRVAIKVLSPKGKRHVDAALMKRFRKECEVLANLTHPNIVQVIDAGECGLSDDRNAPYLIMEYFGAASLRARIAAGKVSAIEAKLIAHQVCSALLAAHERGIIHRDVKPENILLDENGICKVADFGIAANLHLADRLTSDGLSPRTPQYAAPEILNGEQGDERSDVYSCGILLYEILTSSLPRLGCKRVTEICPELDGSWDDVIAEATAEDSAERFQSIGALAQAIESIPVDESGAGICEKDGKDGHQESQSVERATTERPIGKKLLIKLVNPTNLFLAAMALVICFSNGWFRTIDNGWYVEIYNAFPIDESGSYLDESIKSELIRDMANRGQAVNWLRESNRELWEDETPDRDLFNAFYCRARYLVTIAFYQSDGNVRMRLWMYDRSEPTNVRVKDVHVPIVPYESSTDEDLSKRIVREIQEFVSLETE